MTDSPPRQRPPRRRLAPRPEAPTTDVPEAPVPLDVPVTVEESATGSRPPVNRHPMTESAVADNHSIATDLLPLAIPVGDLTEHPENARRHTARDIPVLMESLRIYGQRKPIVGKRVYRDLENVIIAGNGTLVSARRLEWTDIAVTWFEGTDDEADEYALVDNRTAELSTWDLETLARQLRTVNERSGAEAIQRMGWSVTESAPLLAAEWSPATPGHLPGREVSWRSLSLSLGQWLVVELAIQRIQQRENDPSMPEGRCIELIAADLLGGPAE